MYKKVVSNIAYNDKYLKTTIRLRLLKFIQELFAKTRGITDNVFGKIQL